MNASVVKTEDSLHILRQDTAYMQAQALKELYPDTQVAIGPTIENGFYVEPFDRINPTAENLVAWVYRQLLTTLNGTHFKVNAVTL